MATARLAAGGGKVTKALFVCASIPSSAHVVAGHIADLEW
jgi:hypothetical protein